jgi:hypothetical protein
MTGADSTQKDPRDTSAHLATSDFAACRQGRATKI